MNFDSIRFYYLEHGHHFSSVYNPNIVLIVRNDSVFLSSISLKIDSVNIIMA